MGYRSLALVAVLTMLLVAAPTAVAQPHVVQPGESLWSISAANGISVESLAAANGLPPETHVWAGRTVEIPAPTAATPAFSANGRLPSSTLTAIYSPLGYTSLSSDAAAAWEEMRQASVAELGVDLYPAGPASGYRSFDQQAGFYDAFQAGPGPLAAPPGGSAHGAGRAVDLASPEMRQAVDQIGARYGWAKVEAGDEWFHVNYVGR
jgi:LAS superfamily LD-carboxypeptidase LdcB